MPDYSTWLTKQRAAEAIGVSTKTVEKMAADKKIQQATRKSDSGANVAVYHPEDVERIRKERNPDAEPFVLSSPGETAATETRQLAKPNSMDMEGVARLVAQMMSGSQSSQNLISGNASQNSQKSSISVDRKPLLTIQEAQEYTGLSRGLLLEANKSGKLPAFKIGRKWRVKRADLDGFIEKL